jgi:hypothetical protein
MHGSEDDAKKPMGPYFEPDVNNDNKDHRMEYGGKAGVRRPFSWEVQQAANDALRQQNNARERAKAAKIQQQQSAASGAGAGQTPPPKTAPVQVMSPAEIDEYEKRRQQAFLDSDWKKPFLQGTAK